MLKEKVILSLAILIILCWGISNIVNYDREFNAYKSEQMITYPIINGNVIIGTKSIEPLAFRNLINLTVQQVTSSSSLQTKTEFMIGGVINDITLEPIEPKKIFLPTYSEDEYIKSVIYKIFSENRPLVRRMIKVYNIKWDDKEFRDKVEKFVKENE